MNNRIMSNPGINGRWQHACWLHTFNRLHHSKFHRMLQLTVTNRLLIGLHKRNQSQQTNSAIQKMSERFVRLQLVSMRTLKNLLKEPSIIWLSTTVSFKVISTRSTLLESQDSMIWIPSYGATVELINVNR